MQDIPNRPKPIMHRFETNIQNSLINSLISLHKKQTNERRMDIVANSLTTESDQSPSVTTSSARTTVRRR